MLSFDPVRALEIHDVAARNLVPRGPICHALEIGTPGQVQQNPGFEWLYKLKRLRPEPIRFVRLSSGHAQSDGKSVNRGVGPGQRSRSPSMTKRIAASGNEIEQRVPTE